MSRDIDAVIAALRVALNEAQQSDDLWWPVEASNRWVRQLPGGWIGKWNNLILHGDFQGEVPRQEFVAHVRSTIAFLETKLAALNAKRFRPWWLWFSRNVPSTMSREPVEAEFVELKPASSEKSSKSKQSVRLIK